MALEGGKTGTAFYLLTN
jgi:hypothetical protein